MSFTVENNKISFIQISWSGNIGKLCAWVGAARGFLAVEYLPIRITDYAFAEPHYGVKGTFKSNTLASGTINLTDDGSLRPDCKGTYELAWEATRE